MPGLLENRIVSVEPDASRHTVRLRWANGSQTETSFAHLVGNGVFAAFRDPAVFCAVEIRHGGSSLEWPGEIDVDADSLWFEAHPEDNPFVAPAGASKPVAAE